MSKNRIAFMPLNTYPEPAPDDAIRAAVKFAASLDSSLQIVTYAVDIPTMYSPLGNLLLDVPELVRAAELKCRNACQRLGELAQDAAGSAVRLEVSSREVVLGGAFDAAAVQARYSDFALMPWSAESISHQDLTQAVVFGSGTTHRRGTVVSQSGTAQACRRRLGRQQGCARAPSAMPSHSLEAGDRVTVLTVQDEKPLAWHKIARNPCHTPRKARGFAAQSKNLALGKQPVADVLQNGALEAGAASCSPWAVSVIPRPRFCPRRRDEGHPLQSAFACAALALMQKTQAAAGRQLALRS